MAGERDRRRRYGTIMGPGGGGGSSTPANSESTFGKFFWPIVGGGAAALGAYGIYKGAKNLGYWDQSRDWMSNNLPTGLYGALANTGNTLSNVGQSLYEHGVPAAAAFGQRVIGAIPGAISAGASKIGEYAGNFADSLGQLASDETPDSEGGAQTNLSSPTGLIKSGIGHAKKLYHGVYGVATQPAQALESIKQAGRDFLTPPPVEPTPQGFTPAQTNQPSAVVNPVVQQHAEGGPVPRYADGAFSRAWKYNDNELRNRMGLLATSGASMALGAKNLSRKGVLAKILGGLGVGIGGVGGALNTYNLANSIVSAYRGEQKLQQRLGELSRSRAREFPDREEASLGYIPPQNLEQARNENFIPKTRLPGVYMDQDPTRINPLNQQEGGPTTEADFLLPPNIGESKLNNLPNPVWNAEASGGSVPRYEGGGALELSKDITNTLGGFGMAGAGVGHLFAPKDEKDKRSALMRLPGNILAALMGLGGTGLGAFGAYNTFKDLRHFYRNWMANRAAQEEPDMEREGYIKDETQTPPVLGNDDNGERLRDFSEHNRELALLMKAGKLKTQDDTVWHHQGELADEGMMTEPLDPAAMQHLMLGDALGTPKDVPSKDSGGFVPRAEFGWLKNLGGAISKAGGQFFSSLGDSMSGSSNNQQQQGAQVDASVNQPQNNSQPNWGNTTNNTGPAQAFRQNNSDGQQGAAPRSQYMGGTGSYTPAPQQYGNPSQQHQGYYQPTMLDQGLNAATYVAKSPWLNPIAQGLLGGAQAGLASYMNGQPVQNPQVQGANMAPVPQGSPTPQVGGGSSAAPAEGNSGWSSYIPSLAGTLGGMYMMSRFANPYVGLITGAGGLLGKNLNIPATMSGIANGALPALKGWWNSAKNYVGNAWNQAQTYADQQAALREQEQTQRDVATANPTMAVPLLAGGANADGYTQLAGGGSVERFGQGGHPRNQYSGVGRALLGGALGAGLGLYGGNMYASGNLPFGLKGDWGHNAEVSNELDYNRKNELIRRGPEWFKAVSNLVPVGAGLGALYGYNS